MFVYAAALTTNHTEQKNERRRNITIEEQNAICYAAGYVRKFKKRYEDKGPVNVVQCLLSMEEGSEMDNDTGADYSYKDYTKIWVNLVDCGGLFKVNDGTYSFFLELELSMYPLLRASFESRISYQKDGVLKHILDDEDVLFAWALLCIHLDDASSNQLWQLMNLWGSRLMTRKSQMIWDLFQGQVCQLFQALCLKKWRIC